MQDPERPLSRWLSGTFEPTGLPRQGAGSASDRWTGAFWNAFAHDTERAAMVAERLAVLEAKVAAAVGQSDSSYFQ